MQVLVTEEIELIEHDNLVGFLLVVGTQEENPLAVEQEGEHVFDANTSFSEQGHHVGSSTHLVVGKTDGIHIGYRNVDALVAEYPEGFLCVIAYQTIDAEV